MTNLITPRVLFSHIPIALGPTGNSAIRSPTPITVAVGYPGTKHEVDRMVHPVRSYRKSNRWSVGRQYTYTDDTRLRYVKANTHVPPTQLNSTVESRWRRWCVLGFRNVARQE